ncbi:hypothetical protein CCZ01_01870 [Helicobacter monodelphidis]|uniref:agmatine deiminase family protein n=1 Tax=Helicobacter sp. 15-1451 TaxID=2004995 RepID=UPI000DCBB02A|nr:agmatine deiminase family protein [Helicobacter sp. 15-1451]RAX58963.1 hypothetical protein CCZ01_01870 [Helicobacter sp. 15-1451]
MQKLIAECEKIGVDGVLLVMPHKKSDWVNYLQEAQQAMRELIKHIIQECSVIIVLPPDEGLQSLCDLAQNPRIIPIHLPSNDTWARDFAPLCVRTQKGMALLDFNFNGWGLKFAANFDNKISKELVKAQIFNIPLIQKNLVLEGGSIECNSQGILITTQKCLLEPNRNHAFTQTEIEIQLQKELGATEICWLKHGFLSGDDTDSHIDNLVRFIKDDTIIYCISENSDDEHYVELQAMKQELEEWSNGRFKLIGLPLPSPLFYDGERLPASYLNFLILNQTILMPTYGLDTDAQALRILQDATDFYQVKSVDCSVFVRQHGSLHCMSMQFPKGSLKQRI